MTDAEFDQLTARRADLIRKKNRDGLTPAEREEYERLTAISRAVTVARQPAHRGEAVNGTPGADRG